jgi:AraC-like DNA-binding protein
VFISRVYQIIEENLSDENFTVNTLVEETGTSYSQFFSRVKKITGHSPKDLLLSSRLEKAKELLKGGENNVSEIAYMVGFSSLSSFSRAFKNKFGTKPSSV